MVSSDDKDLVDSDDGSVTDLDRDMSEEEDCVDSDDGSVADLDKRIVVIRIWGPWRILNGTLGRMRVL